MKSFTKSPTTWARAVGRLVDYLVGRGMDREKLVRKASLDSDLLADADARVPVAAFYDVVEMGAQALGDPLLGLNYINDVGFASADAAGFLAMSSRTVGEAMRRFIHHHERLASDGELKLSLVGQRAVFTCSCWGPERVGLAHRVEMYAAGFLILAARFTEPIDVSSLTFTHAARPGATPEAYVRLLGRVPTFGAPANTWSFHKDVLTRPMLGANPELAAFFENYLQTRVVPRTTPLLVTLRRAIGAALPEGKLTLAAVARRVSMSTRSLQRRLESEAYSFDDLVQEVRHAQAVAYLSAGLPIADISYLLGYADPVAFHRAFKRWTDTTPSEWRRAHAETG